MVHAVRSHLGKLLAERDGRHVRRHEESVVIGQFFHLACGDICQTVATVADIDAPQASHTIDDPVPVTVRDPDTVSARDHARAALCQDVLRGERVHVVRGIQRLEFMRGHMV